jgi:methylated-DNA-[protein]-cysteine S-methyltransferase
MIILTCSFDTPLGPVTAAAEGENLTGLWFAGQKYYPATRDWQTKPDHPVFENLRVWLKDYFAGVNMNGAYKKRFHLRPAGTDFQQKVWRALLEIPSGTLSNYGALARRLDSSARAVGGAVGRNPISLVIPCHRVVGASGALTGYAGGLDRKRALLELEGSLPAGQSPHAQPNSVKL